MAQAMDPSELYSYAKQLGVSYPLLKQTAELGRLPVVNFAAGGLGKWIHVCKWGWNQQDIYFYIVVVQLSLIMNFLLKLEIMVTVTIFSNLGRKP